ncbi:hypothetical protein LBMAG33_3680 [Candidatus Levyibacteriota bacterium]|nr:hypothetical protein [Candidatus Levybacteria bacterium]GDX62058.1 hypothetical protein LBMAG33_3680 [Candidatus Levybacteria bacterium]
MKDKTKKSVLQIVIIIIVIIIIGHSAANKVRIISPLPSASYDFKKLGIISWVTQVIKNMTSEDKNNKIRILSTNIPDLKTNNNKKVYEKDNNTDMFEEDNNTNILEQSVENDTLIQDIKVPNDIIKNPQVILNIAKTFYESKKIEYEKLIEKTIKNIPIISDNPNEEISNCEQLDKIYNKLQLTINNEIKP